MENDAKSAGSGTGQSPCSVPFHQWLRQQDQWVIVVAQSDTVYQAMKLSYEANADLERTARSDGTLQDFVGGSDG